MKQCISCHTELTAHAINSGRCPQCGAVLLPLDEKAVGNETLALNDDDGASDDVLQQTVAVNDFSGKTAPSGPDLGATIQISETDNTDTAVPEPDDKATAQTIAQTSDAGADSDFEMGGSTGEQGDTAYASNQSDRPDQTIVASGTAVPPVSDDELGKTIQLSEPTGDEAPSSPDATVAVTPQSPSPNLDQTIVASDTTAPPENYDLGATVSFSGDAGSGESQNFDATVALSAETPEDEGGNDKTIALGSAASPASDNDNLGKTISLRDFSEGDFEVWGQKATAFFPDDSEVSNKPKQKKTAATLQPGGPSGDTLYTGKTSVAVRALVGLDGKPQPKTTTVPADYSINSKLGAGNMGVVYDATQRSMNRPVALKTIKPEGRKQRDQLDNLASEAIVTGNLVHPNIVPVYDLGRDSEGNLFYSMKKVQGTTWDETLKSNSEAKNLDIFLRVCDAVAFGHSRGVVHRDLKPENVIVADYGEVLVMDWGLAYATKDFARIDSIIQNVTMGGSPAYMSPEAARNFMVMGGFVEGSPTQITPSVDIYLLGSILYEMITGYPPHSGRDLMACVVAASNNKIRDAKDANPGLLEIAMKAMATNVEDRYQTVEELQEAVHEYEAHAESITLTHRANEHLNSGNLARAVATYEDAIALWDGNEPAQQQYKIAQRRLERKRYTVLALTAALLLVTVGGFAGISSQWMRAETARKDAEKQRDIAVVAQQEADEAKLVAIQEREVADQEREIADRERKKAEELAVAERKAKEAEELARIEQEKLRVEAEDARDTANRAKNVAEAERLKQAYLNYLARIKLAAQRVDENDIGEGNRLLDELYAASPDLCGWEWQHLKYLCSQGKDRLQLRNPISAIATSQDGSRTLAATSGGAITLWGLDSFSEAHPTPLWEARDVSFEQITAVDISDDGKKIAVAGQLAEDVPTDVILWRDTNTGGAPLRLSGHLGTRVLSAKFSDDQTRLVTTGDDGTVRIWDAGDGRLLLTTPKQADRWLANDAVISPDGSLLVAAGIDGTVPIWKLELTADGLTANSLGYFDGHRKSVRFADGSQYREGTVDCIRFLPDGRVLSGGRDGALLLWNPATVPLHARMNISEAIETATQIASGESTGLNSKDVSYSFIDVPAHEGAIQSLGVGTDSNGQLFAVTVGDDTLVKVWMIDHLDAAKLAQVQPVKVFRGHTDEVASVAVIESGDEPGLLSGGLDGRVIRWNLSAGGDVRVLTSELTGHRDAILAGQFTSDGLSVLTAGRDEVVSLFNLETGERRTFAEGHDAYAGISSVVPTPDGKYLVTTAYDGVTQIWDTSTATQRARIEALPMEQKAGDTVFDAFTPMTPIISSDSQWLVTDSDASADDFRLALWKLETVLDVDAELEPVAVIDCLSEPTVASFSTDEKQVLIGDSDGRCYVWDLASNEVKSFSLHSGRSARVTVVRPLPGGTEAVSAAEDYTVIRWNTSTGEPVPNWSLKHPGWVEELEVTADGRYALTTSGPRNASNELRLWDLRTTEELLRINLPNAQISEIELSPDDKKLLLVTNPKKSDEETTASTVRLLEIPALREIRFDPKSGRAIPTTQQQKDSVPLLNSELLRDTVFAAAFTADGTGLFTGGLKGVNRWSIEGRDRVGTRFVNHGAVLAIDDAPDGRVVAVGNQDGSFVLLDTLGARLTGVFKADASENRKRITAIRFDPTSSNGEYRLAVGSPTSLSLWSVVPGGKSDETVLLKGDSNGPQRGVTDLAYSKDGKHLIAGGADGSVWLWDLSQPQQPGKQIGGDDENSRQHQSRVNSVSVANTDDVPAEILVIGSASNDRSGIVWVVEKSTGRLLAQSALLGHANAVEAITFAGRFDRVITGSEDLTVRVWDWDGSGSKAWTTEKLQQLPDGYEVMTLRRHTAGVTDVDFSPNLTDVLSTGRDGRAVLWLGEKFK
ncbi:protein kinase domain-containing protein [Calycomorphotria hydatis]|uniref:Serine/threonine-protein kinase PknD n=1 Tax=Calycomorphotria hydatis TaxID=2528027 RepID=A0A517T4A8_9PLAN|nr:protein kinase [Calycomorphotria hydatis]QDT63213.1 Serine/threonine-protein kinase PknD [Calycomorphotria hydatis]